MVERDIGEATIVYEDPEEGTIEWTRQNEHIAYFQDHWIVRVGESDDGVDEVRRIPAQRVYYVERSVEEFEEEVSTLRDQVQSFADDLQTKILGGGSGGRGEGRSESGGGDRSGSRGEGGSGSRDGSEAGGESGSEDEGGSGNGDEIEDGVGSQEEQGP